MKKLFLLVVLIAVAFIAFNRYRIFIRDPLANVMRDGVKEQGAQVFINYPNDVLLINESSPMYITLVQRAQPIGFPAGIHCMHWIACFTDADKATVLSSDPRTRIESMTSKVVQFRDDRGREAVVTLH